MLSSFIAINWYAAPLQSPPAGGRSVDGDTPFTPDTTIRDPFFHRSFIKFFLKWVRMVAKDYKWYFLIIIDFKILVFC